MNIFLSDILSQPEALRAMLARYNLDGLEPVRKSLQSGQFRKIILTGMGASYSGLYPAWLQLASTGLPAIWVNSAELLHHTSALIGRDSLVLITSQSGRSAEIVGLLDVLDHLQPAGLIALTNDHTSPLGEFANRSGGNLVSLFAEPESSVSTRTYLNTLAISQMIARVLTADISAAGTSSLVQSDLLITAERLQDYLASYEDHLRILSMIFAGKTFPPKIVFLGRGPSLASAMTGALNIQEASKLPAMGMHTAEFRHGPLEIADKDLTTIIFLGDPHSSEAELNHRLWVELKNMGSNAWLVGRRWADLNTTDNRCRIELPDVPVIGLPLIEMLPVQLICNYLADLQGIQPGSFRHIGKVTENE